MQITFEFFITIVLGLLKYGENLLENFESFEWWNESPYCHVKHYMKYFWILHFQKWARTRAARPIKKFAKFSRFALPRTYARIPEKSGAHVRAMARDHVLKYVDISTKLKIIHERFESRWSLHERMQLWNPSNKTKMPLFSVSFASLMWKNVEKHFVDIFIYESFIVLVSFKRIFKIMIESFTA